MEDKKSEVIMVDVPCRVYHGQQQVVVWYCDQRKGFVLGKEV